jgi:Putative esterase
MMVLGGGCKNQNSKNENSNQKDTNLPTNNKNPQVKIHPPKVKTKPTVKKTVKKTGPLTIAKPKTSPYPKPKGISPLLKKYPKPSFLTKFRKTYPETEIRKDYLHLVSKIMGKKFPVHVILPASYDSNPGRSYPYLILLGGNHFIKGGPFSSIRYWDWIFNIARRYSNLLSGNLAAEVKKTFHGDYYKRWKTIISKSLPMEMVIVLPHTDKFINFTHYSKYLLREMIPQLHQIYRLHHHPKFAGIDGISLGATQALKIGLNNLDIFQVLGAVQPSINHNTEMLTKLFTSKNKELLSLNVPFNWVTGKNDIARWRVVKFYKKLKKLGNRVYFKDYPGSHDYYFYQGVGVTDLLLYYGYRFMENHKQLFGDRIVKYGKNMVNSPAKSSFKGKPPTNFKKNPNKNHIVLVSEYSPLISIYKSVKSISETDNFKPVFHNLIKKVPSGTSAIRIKSFTKGMLGNSTAEFIKLADGTAGWVDLNFIALPARIKANEFKRKNTRVFETASIEGPVVEKLVKGDGLYIFARDTINLWKYSECDLQMERVYTFSGKIGYVNCVCLKPGKTSFKR